MKKILPKALKNILVLAGITFAVTASILFSLFTTNLLEDLTKQHLEKDTQTIEAHLNDRLQNLRSSLDRIKKSEELNAIVKAQEIDKIREFFEKTTRKEGFELGLMTDNNGIVIFRAENKNVIGDYVYNNNPWGRAVIKGQEITTIEKSGLMPLISVAGSPLLDEDGNFMAGIFIGEKVDKDLTLELKHLETRNNIEVAFYTKEEGIFASSFENQDDENNIKRFFNEGSEWIKNGRGSEDIEKIRIINSQYHHIKNIVFEGLEHSPGGMLVFHRSFNQQGIILYLSGFITLTLIAYFSFLLIIKKRTERIIYLLVVWLIFDLISVQTSSKIKSLQPVNPDYDSSIVYNSTAKLEPETGVFKKNTEHEVKIIINTAGEKINAANFNIKYNPEIVAVSEINIGNSICSKEGFVEKIIDQTEGLVKIGCVIFKESFNGSRGEIAGFKLRTLREGDYVLRFEEDSNVFASDGLGTEVLRSTRGGSYQVIDQKSKKQGFPEILIFSDSHQNQTRWYNDKKVRITWIPVEDEYNQYQWLINKNADTIKNWENSEKTKNNEIETSNLEDGENYFHIIGEKNGVLGPESKLKIRIDTTPPEPVKLKITNRDVKVGDLIRVSFTGSDITSGVQSFYAKINNRNYFPVESTFFIPFTAPGKYYLSIRVFDQADNYRDTEIEINVSGRNILERLLNLSGEKMILL